MNERADAPLHFSRWCKCSYVYYFCFFVFALPLGSMNGGADAPLHLSRWCKCSYDVFLLFFVFALPLGSMNRGADAPLLLGRWCKFVVLYTALVILICVLCTLRKS
jgi:hypothetical protein